MDTGWIVVVILALIAGGSLLWRARRSTGGGPTTAAGEHPLGNSTDARERTRVGALSEEDRTWEAASLQRFRDQQARAEAPPTDQP